MERTQALLKHILKRHIARKKGDVHEIITFLRNLIENQPKRLIGTEPQYLLRIKQNIFKKEGLLGTIMTLLSTKTKL